MLRKAKDDSWRSADDTDGLECGERVIIQIGDFFVCEGWLGASGKWFRNGLEVEKFFGEPVTYWQYMPKPMKVEKKKENASVPK